MNKRISGLGIHVSILISELLSFFGVLLGDLFLNLFISLIDGKFLSLGINKLVVIVIILISE